jgi:hypothetical protein
MSGPSNPNDNPAGGSQLAAATREFAAKLYDAVASQYLEFRHKYYGESNPSLASVPPKSTAVQQTEAGKIAELTLKTVPGAVRGFPLIRDIIDHLQWEVDIHTLTERERTELHNLTMIYLYGVKDGIQPWYVAWILDIERKLQGATHPDYYLAFPFQGLFYRSPHDLAAFEVAIRDSDIAGIEHEMQRIANGLIEVLRDPLGTQPRLAFSGADGERRRILFNLKTSAGLALGAYLAVDTVRELLGANRQQPPPQSVIQSFPRQITERLLPEE